LFSCGSGFEGGDVEKVRRHTRWAPGLLAKLPKDLDEDASDGGKLVDGVIRLEK